MTRPRQTDLFDAVQRLVVLFNVELSCARSASGAVQAAHLAAADATLKAIEQLLAAVGAEAS